MIIKSDKIKQVENPPLVLLVEMFFDWYSRSWIVQTKDQDGNQVEEALFVWTRLEARDEVRRRRAEIKKSLEAAK